MRNKSPAVRVGVLNMTISFDLPHKPTQRRTPEHPPKTNTLPTFIPRYSNQRHQPQLPIPVNESISFSPYQQYRTHKDSLRTMREQQFADRNSRNRIGGLQPHEKTIQLTIKETPSHEDERQTNRSAQDTRIRLVYNKRHLRNIPDGEFQGEQLAFNFNRNPQENLRSIFTVRTAKTSQRYRQQNPNSSPSWKRTMGLRLGTGRMTQKPKPERISEFLQRREKGEKIIRPWSTSRRQNMQESMLLCVAP